MRTLLVTVVAAALAAAPVAAQVVHGRVVEAGSGSAVAGAMVRLLPEGAGDTTAVRADSAGGFTLRAPEGGEFRLAAARWATARPSPPRWSWERVTRWRCSSA